MVFNVELFTYAYDVTDAPVEVHEDVAERLHVVTSRLFDAEMRVDAGVARRAGEVLVLAVRDVLSRAVVAVLLGQTEVD